MSIKIMIVDDELDMESLILQKFRRQIKNNDLSFVFAHNGFEALAVLASNNDVDIILTDINMPEMDGLTLLLKLQELKLPTLRTVVVSAYGDMENIRTAMNRGAFDFVTKPIDFNDLEITINKTIEQLNILRQYEKDHDKLVAIEFDLNIARDIQNSILPKTFPPFPELSQLDVYASMNAAKEVGGDFYDFFFIDDSHLACIIADVSGKGVPASLFMAITRTLVRAKTEPNVKPNVIFENVNRMLCKENPNSMFVTSFMGILDIHTGEFAFCNAGHNYPYIIKNNNDLVCIDKKHGLPLGLFEKDYLSDSIFLEKNDRIILYTDGVTEAMNKDFELYGEDRLCELLKSISTNNPKDINDLLIADVNKFVDGADQSDDITTLILSFYKD
ncbi:MAG: fused response regulator/phosphatase [Bacteroidetes bacterium GWE2_29_8]|nr:MAG: fused response regulator/phosphatase [Bacteroidetes bacterium GWE2_29_8]OFY24603.1 MAG: fused response regulator/phosphatase [Bacteroidetes bacterium GWF2_29_10]